MYCFLNSASSIQEYEDRLLRVRTGETSGTTITLLSLAVADDDAGFFDIWLLLAVSESIDLCRFVSDLLSLGAVALTLEASDFDRDGHCSSWFDSCCCLDAFVTVGCGVVMRCGCMLFFAAASEHRSFGYSLSPQCLHVRTCWK